MTIGGIILLAICGLCIWAICKGEHAKIGISGMTAASVTCIAIGAIGLRWLFGLSGFSAPFLILCIAFFAVGIVLGFLAFKKGLIKKDVTFTGFAGAAVVSGLFAIKMLFVW